MTDFSPQVPASYLDYVGMRGVSSAGVWGYPSRARKGMGIQAMKVMGGALGSLAQGNPIKNDGKPHHDDAPHQATAGLLIRYVLGLPISVAVVGMSSLDQLRTNVAAVRAAQPLNEMERAALEQHMSGKPQD